MASATGIRLSRNDSAVLGALFDPEASLNNRVRTEIQSHGPYEPPILSTIKEQERAALVGIDVEQPTMANIERVISDLSKIIQTYALYASAWNNRAQARRLLYDIDRNSQRSGQLRGTFTDLAKAIELASPANAIQTVSPEDKRVLASAHTHRGYLLWRASRPEAPSNTLDEIEVLSKMNKDQLEEMASRDFSLGGRYGNQTAQQLAVRTNPYAKLCGSIVREALQKEIKDSYGVGI